MEKVSLAEKLSRFSDHWNPRIVGELNGQQVKLVKFQGEFVWHHHDHEDELFLVVEGRFRMEFRDRDVWLDEGEFLIVPRGVEHRPVADEEVPRAAVRAGGDAQHRQRRRRTNAWRAEADLTRSAPCAVRAPSLSTRPEIYCRALWPGRSAVREFSA